MQKEIRNIKDKTDVKQMVLNFEPKLETDELTDEKIVQSVKKLGKASLERHTGARIQPSGLVRSFKDSPAEALEKLDKMIKEKQKDLPPDLVVERDQWGRIRFKIVQKEEQDIENFDDVNLLNKNKTAIDKILEDDEQKKKYEKPACPNFKSEKCPANKYGEPIKGKVPDEAKKCENNKKYTCPYLKTGYGYGVKTGEGVQEKVLIESTIEDIFEIGPFSESTILPNQSLIKGVCVLGRKSKNNREYSEGALQQLADLMQSGIKVFCDHKPERSVKDILGYLKNAVVENKNKVKADFKVMPANKWVFDLATEMPFGAGFSIVAKGKTYNDMGIEKVEEIISLQSCDLVAFPATTQGIFEAERKYNEKEESCKRWNLDECPVHGLGEDVSACPIHNQENCPYNKPR